MRWGDEIGVNDPDIRECFKSLVDAKECGAAHILGMPTWEEALSLVRRYLSCLCERVAIEINREMSKPKLEKWQHWKIIWRFTVPGCWKENIVKDFVGEAKAGVKEWFNPEQYPNLEITANVTEGQASAMSAILNGLSTHRVAGSCQERQF